MIVITTKSFYVTLFSLIFFPLFSPFFFPLFSFDFTWRKRNPFWRSAHVV